jgi:hypothetical protein
MKSQRKHQFFLAKAARFGSKKWCHQKYILTIEAQSFFENIVYLLITLLVQKKWKDKVKLGNLEKISKCPGLFQ